MSDASKFPLRCPTIPLGSPARYPLFVPVPASTRPKRKFLEWGRTPPPVFTIGGRSDVDAYLRARAARQPQQNPNPPSDHIGLNEDEI